MKKHLVRLHTLSVGSMSISISFPVSVCHLKNMELINEKKNNKNSKICDFLIIRQIAELPLTYLNFDKHL